MVDGHWRDLDNWHLYAPYVEQLIEEEFTRKVALDMISEADRLKRFPSKLKADIPYSAFNYNWEMRVDLPAYQKQKEEVTGGKKWSNQTWVGLIFHGTNDGKLYPPGVLITSMMLHPDQDPKTPHKFHFSKAHSDGIEGYYRLDSDKYLPEIRSMVDIATKWFQCVPDISIPKTIERTLTSSTLRTDSKTFPHPPVTYGPVEGYDPIPQSFIDHIKNMKEEVKKKTLEKK